MSFLWLYFLSEFVPSAICHGPVRERGWVGTRELSPIRLLLRAEVFQSCTDSNPPFPALLRRFFVRKRLRRLEKWLVGLPARPAARVQTRFGPAPDARRSTHPPYAPEPGPVLVVEALNQAVQRQQKQGPFSSPRFLALCTTFSVIVMSSPLWMIIATHSKNSASDEKTSHAYRRMVSVEKGRKHIRTAGIFLHPPSFGRDAPFPMSKKRNRKYQYRGSFRFQFIVN